MLTLRMPNGEIVKCLDSAENIARCLACPLPDCVNCSGSNPKEVYRKRKLEEKRAKARELVAGGMQQKEVAAQLGVSEGSISRWVNGRVGPRGTWGQNRWRVMELYNAGRTKAEIAEELGISWQMVNRHLQKAKEASNG